MSNCPPWLPDMVPIDGERGETIARLYSIFVTDIKDGKPRLNGSQVWWDRNKLEGEEYEEGFWHLITREFQNAGNRQFDPQRAKRLPWCRACIENCTDTPILFWDYKVRKRIETYIWLKDFDYVLILKKLIKSWGTAYFLITAYHVDGNSRRRSLMRKYNDKL